MITDAEAREIIRQRLQAVNGQCNSGLIDHTDGMMRGLIWAITGEDPGTCLTTDTENLCRLAGIPVERCGDEVHFLAMQPTQKGTA